MKHVQKGNLNIGIQAFVLNREFQGRLAIQQKPITWDWDTNEVLQIRITPNLLSDFNTMDKWRRTMPYTLFYNNNESEYCKDWKRAIESAEYHLNRVGAKIGLTPIDIQKQFIKNEPKITFSEVYEILRKMEML